MKGFSPVKMMMLVGHFFSFLIEKCWLWLGFVKVVEAWNIFGCLNFWWIFFWGLGGFTCQIFAWPMKRKDRIYQH